MHWFVKLVELVAVKATGVQPEVVFKVNRGISGGSMQICRVFVVIPQKFCAVKVTVYVPDTR